jgi:heterodisulfide reductase subunit B
LREVIDEYLRKYGKELDKNTIESYLSEQEKGEINLSKIKETAQAHISSCSLSESCSGIQAIAS